LCHVEIAGDFLEHNFLSKSMLKGFEKYKDFEIGFCFNFFLGQIFLYPENFAVQAGAVVEQSSLSLLMNRIGA
jgi:hypothetical protein